MLTCPAPDGSLLPPNHRPFFFDALHRMAAGGFSEGVIKPQLADMADRFAALSPSDDELLAWHAELQAWVRWYRVPGYWLAAMFQNGTIRLPSLYAVLSTRLFAAAQVMFADDLALSSLETAYVGVRRNQVGFGSDFDRVRDSLEGILGDYQSYLARWATPFEYLRCNPLADHFHSRLTAAWFAEDLAEDNNPPRLDNESWLRDFIVRVDHDQLVWHQVVARRFLGLCLTAKGDDQGRREHFRAALDIARKHRLDTEIGHLHRLLGKTLRDAGQLDEAVAQLEQAVGFEGAAPGQELATYWQALSLRELGDVLFQRALLTSTTMLAGSGAGHADLQRAVQVYSAGRKNFAMHLALQCPQPLARAGKHQMQRSFADNALHAAAVGQSQVDLLAELEESGPREATAMVIAMAAPEIATGADRTTFRRNRANYFATLNTTPQPFADFLADVVANPEQRRAYLAHYIAQAGHTAKSQGGDDIAKRVLALRLPDTLFLLFHLGANSGSLVLVDLSAGDIAPFRLDFGEQQVRAWHAEYLTDWAGAAGQPGKSAALRRHLARYEQALAATLEPMLRFFPGRHLKIFPRLHMNAVPFHAMQIKGKVLLQHCETLSYGQTLGLFLANHRAREQAHPSLYPLRVVVGRDVPWYQRILPGLQQTYGSGMQVHARVPWSELLAAIALRPARDTVFACHGRFDATQVISSALELGAAGSDSKVSFARVFEQLDLQGCRSVIMGSCESGVVRTEVAAEYLGLPAAMLASGVRYVVGALWTIPQLATAVVMERLLASLPDESLSVAVALSRLQRDMIELGREQVLSWIAERFAGHPQLSKLLSEMKERGDHPFADPYHWAGLQTLGDI